MDPIGESILDQQRVVYRTDAAASAPPPMFPHGDDPKAIPPRNAKCRKKSPQRAAPLPTLPDGTEAEKALPASEIPNGFPPDLTFRALAAYATVRTLSLQLRLSPFTPNVFLRALYLPYPNRLLGRLHTHILRLLLSYLQMGYHWKQEGSTPPLNVSKKRKIDGIRWPLRAGDNLRLLDTYTWPIFYDDYCHLTADILHAAMHDNTDYANTSGIDSEAEKDGRNDARSKRQASQTTGAYVDDGDSDEEFQMEEEDYEDDDDDYSVEVERPKKRRKKTINKQQTLSTVANLPACSSFPVSPSYTHGYNYTSYPTTMTNSFPTYASQMQQLQMNAALEHDQIYRQQSIYAQWQQSLHPFPHEYRVPLPVNGMHASPYAQFQQSLALDYRGQQLQVNGITVGPYLHWQQSFAPRYSGQEQLSVNNVMQALCVSQTVNQGPTNYSLSNNLSAEVGQQEQNNPLHENGQSQKTNIGLSIQPCDDNKRTLPVNHPSIQSLHENNELRMNSVSSIQPTETGENKSSTQLLTTPSRSSIDETTVFPSLDESTILLSASKRGVVEDSVFLIKSPLESLRSLSAATFTETDKDDPAYIVKAYVHGKSMAASQPVDEAENVNSTNDDNDSNPFSLKDDSGYWPQFGPLKTMRSGLPYHQLSVEQKLVILEFLLDELLSIDIIAAEFSNRHDATSCYVLPYGPLPSQAELQNLEDHNEDECCVCREEGELICCDGCIASYHRNCAMLPDTGDLPEPWLCPECDLKDPATYGTLNGGRKSAVDWFTIADVREAYNRCDDYHRVVRPSHQQVLPMNNGCFGATTTDMNGGLTSGHMPAHLQQLAFVNGVFFGDASMHIKEAERKRKLLVVHGFVFCRSLEKGREAEGATLLPLNETKLKDILSSFGADVCSMWPIAQVPNQAYLLFGSPGSDDKKIYFKTPENFDPSFYENKYRQAPHPDFMRRVKDSHLMDYEVRCTPATTRALSNFLTCDMSNDAMVAESLLTNTSLFSSYQMIVSFLLRVENDLLRASLLDEFWKTKETSGAKGAWSKAVSDCRSVRRLASLSLQLVDATHPQTFVEGWFYAAQLKAKEPDGRIRCEARVYWSGESGPKDESVRRHWERSHMSHIPNLIAKSSRRLSDWIRDIRPDLGQVQLRNGKRKHTRGKQDQPLELNQIALAGSERQSDSLVTPFLDTMECAVDVGLLDETRSDENGSAFADGQTHEGCMDLSKPTSDGSSLMNKPRNRRKSDRVQSSSERSDSKPNEVAGSSRSNSRIEAQMKRKIADLAIELKIQDNQEMHWPVAGRMLFDPVGYLPKSSIRYLGRNAGGNFAPFVTYNSLHEVGQASYAHIWRKRMLMCTSFEELLVLLRTLESYLDDGVIRKCISLAQRSKLSKTKISAGILWSQRDLVTGIDYHLIGEPGQCCGRWVSSLDIDLGLLMLERSRRRQARIVSMSKKLRESPRIKKGASEATLKVKANHPPSTMDMVLADHKRQVQDLYQEHGYSLSSIPVGFLESLRLTAMGKLQKIYKRRKEARTSEQMLAELAKVEVLHNENATDAAAVDQLRNNKTNNATAVDQQQNSKTNNAKTLGKLQNENTTDSKTLGSLPARAYLPDKKSVATSVASAKKSEAKPVRRRLSSSQSGSGSRKHPKASDCSFVAPSQPLISLAAQIVEDHIAARKIIINKYGKGLIPDKESCALRDLSEKRLSRAIKAEGIKLGKQQIYSVLIQAEMDAHSQINVEATSKQGVRQSDSLRVVDLAPGCQSDSSPAAKPLLTHHHPSQTGMPSGMQDVKQSAYQQVQSGNDTLLHESRAGAAGTYNGISAPNGSPQNMEVGLLMPQFSSIDPKSSADRTFDSSNVPIASYKHDASELDGNDRFWDFPAEATPLDCTQLIVSKHKAATRAVLRKYGASFPPGELLPSRQICLARLTDVLQKAGIVYSTDKITSVLVEAETDVLGEENAEPARYTETSSIPLVHTATSFTAPSPPQVFPISQFASLPSVFQGAHQSSLNSFRSMGNSSRLLQQAPQQWQQQQRQRFAPQQFLQEHLEQDERHYGRKQLPQRSHLEMSDGYIMDTLVRLQTQGQFPSSQNGTTYWNGPSHGAAYGQSTFRSGEQPYLNLNMQPSPGPYNYHVHDVATTGQNVAPYHVGNGPGLYLPGQASTSTTTYQSHLEPPSLGQGLDDDDLMGRGSGSLHDTFHH